GRRRGRGRRVGGRGSGRGRRRRGGRGGGVVDDDRGRDPERGRAAQQQRQRPGGQGQAAGGQAERGEGGARRGREHRHLARRPDRGNLLVVRAVLGIDDDDGGDLRSLALAELGRGGLEVVPDGAGLELGPRQLAHEPGLRRRHLDVVPIVGTGG